MVKTIEDIIKDSVRYNKSITETRYDLIMHGYSLPRKEIKELLFTEKRNENLIKDTKYMGMNYKLKLFKEHGLTKRQVSEIIREENNLSVREANRILKNYTEEKPVKIEEIRKEEKLYQREIKNKKSLSKKEKQKIKKSKKENITPEPEEQRKQWENFNYEYYLILELDEPIYLYQDEGHPAGHTTNFISKGFKNMNAQSDIANYAKLRQYIASQNAKINDIYWLSKSGNTMSRQQAHFDKNGDVIFDAK